MERQLKQMVRMIDDLMDVSRISRGKLELRKERVELASVAQLAVETARPAILAAKQHLSVDVPSGIFVDADVTRMAQVISNLLNNASRYSHEGSHIRLTAARAEEAGVEIRVQDNGLGIPQEMLSRIFDLFTQVNFGSSKAQGGLGIGLSLVKALVEMHGGTVEARSAGSGKGSEFVLRLPESGARPAAASDEAAAQAGAGKMSMLVADDNVDSAESLAMLLQLEGHEVQVAHDGEAALRACAQSRPQVALLDLGMPKLDGYEVCRRIRSEPWGAEMFLIAQTGWGAESDRKRTAEAGFDAHLVKPIDPAALLRILAEPRPKKIPT